MSRTADAAIKGATKTVTVLDNLVADLASLDNPTVASGVVAFILQVTGAAGGIGLSSTDLLEIVTGIGVVTVFVRGLFKNKSTT